MSVSLEQIEMLRERARVTYAEAKEVLEKCNGDILEALIMLEGQAKVRAPKAEFHETGAYKTSKGILSSVKKLIKKGNETKFVISNWERTVIDMPVTLLVIITAVMPPLAVAGILVALLTKHKISFIKPNGEGMNINKTFDKISTCVDSVSSQVKEAINEE